MTLLPTRKGSFRLFRLLGIDVYLHWWWFLVAVYSVQYRTHEYGSFIWNALEYCSLFGIVLMHEFGHALACRQTGGRADQIVLWPFGGVAYVDPPQRPGAVLWSIVAGPLVNFVLVPVLTAVVFVCQLLHVGAGWPDLYRFVKAMWWINTSLLIFNLLPIYPLDGGQILRSLLWFICGRARSLFIASLFALPAGLALLGLAIWVRDIMFGLVCLFILLNCWQGVAQARMLARLAKQPRRAGFACPSCRQPPLLNVAWRCANCQLAFDTFEHGATCPHCGTRYPLTQCIDCGAWHPIQEWATTRAD